MLATGTVVSLFWVQNISRTTQLSIDFGFAAAQLPQPVPIPALLAGTFGAGFVLAFFGMLFRSAGQSRRIRKLEQELTLQPTGDNGGEWR